jgi:hypothetical protein
MDDGGTTIQTLLRTELLFLAAVFTTGLAGIFAASRAGLAFVRAAFFAGFSSEGRSRKGRESEER